MTVSIPSNAVNTFFSGLLCSILHLILSFKSLTNFLTFQYLEELAGIPIPIGWTKEVKYGNKWQIKSFGIHSWGQTLYPKITYVCTAAKLPVHNKRLSQLLSRWVHRALERSDLRSRGEKLLQDSERYEASNGFFFRAAISANCAKSVGRKIASFHGLGLVRRR